MRARFGSWIGLGCVAMLGCTFALGQNNNNPGNSVCLDLRGASDLIATGNCTAADSECAAGEQCTDNDGDPLNGAMCMAQACAGLGEEIVVDLELGSTATAACGAQAFLRWDTAALQFVSIQLDPDAELNWNLVFANTVIPSLGTIDLAVALGIGLLCNDVNGTFDGGTIARVRFIAIGECETFGLEFRDGVIPTSVSGAMGSIPINGCNGDAMPTPIDLLNINEAAPIWNCPENSVDIADCGFETREVLFDPIIVDDCDGVDVTLDGLCSVEFFAACEIEMDCETGLCVDGYCDAPSVPAGVVLDDYLDGGGLFYPGRTEFRCSFTNSCGQASSCASDIVNLGVDETCDDNNFNLPDSLCLDLRGVDPSNTAGDCPTGQGDCADGAFCVDEDLMPTNGGICVSNACFATDDFVIVDVELGPTSEPACGARLALEWDTNALQFTEIAPWPDDEHDWTMVVENSVDEIAGTIDLTLTLPDGVPCDAANGTVNGGTIVRLAFTPTASSCDTFGVAFRAVGPPSAVFGVAGDLAITGCEGGGLPVETSAPLRLYPTESLWTCPSSSTGPADHSIQTREVFFDPVTLADDCGTLGSVADLCTVEYFPACALDSDCDLGTCVGQLCTIPTQPVGVDLLAYLDGGGDFLPGRTRFDCAVTTECGLLDTCSFEIENDGSNRMELDIALSPAMLGIPDGGTITRCIEFELGPCGGGETVTLSTDVVFSMDPDLSAHGLAILDVPAGNWLCVSAVDPAHSLSSTCPTISVGGLFRASFTGAPDAGDPCHWLVQGDLNRSGFVDIVDYTILSGDYLSAPGPNTACGFGGDFHADFNGDGLVTLADILFVMFNFGEFSAAGCDDVCSPIAANSPGGAVRTSISVRELIEMGLARQAKIADVNRDGVVDSRDIGMFSLRATVGSR